MQKPTARDVTDWVNTAPPTDLIPVVKQALSRIGTLPQNERDQFSREIGQDRTVAKLFNADA